MAWRTRKAARRGMRPPLPRRGWRCRRRRPAGEAVAEHDVADEQRAVEEGPEQAERIIRPSDIDQAKHADDRDGERDEVAPASQADERHADGGDEFDRRDQRDRQPVERQIERTVHHGQAGAEREQQGPDAGSALRKTPRPGHR